MAKIESWFNCDLKKAVQAQALNGNVFSLDNNGNRIGVRIFDGGQKATVSGTVTGRCILADGSTVNVNGSLSTADGQSIAYLDIPQGCLLIHGTLRISMQLTASGVITTLLAIVTNVYQTKTDNVITPSAQVIADWNAQISAAIQNQDATIASAVATQNAQISDLKSALTDNVNKTSDLYNELGYEYVFEAEGKTAGQYVRTTVIKGLTFEANKKYIIIAEPVSVTTDSYYAYIFDSEDTQIKSFAHTAGTARIQGTCEPIATRENASIKISADVAQAQTIRCKVYKEIATDTIVERVEGLEKLTSIRTDNLFFFTNTNPRKLDNTVSVNFPNKNIIEYDSEGVSLSSDCSTSLTFGDGYLSAGTPYFYSCDNVAESGTVEIRRVNASTNNIIDRLVPNTAFIPTVNERIMIVFKSGSVQKGKINICITETDNLFDFANLTTRTIDNMTVSFTGKNTITVNSGETQLSRSVSLYTGYELKAGKRYRYIRQINSSGASWVAYRVYSATRQRIVELNSDETFISSANEKIEICYRGSNTQNGSYSFFLFDCDPVTDIEPYYAIGNIEKKAKVPVDYSNEIIYGKNIYLNGTTADIDNLRDSESYCCAIIPCKYGDKFRILSYGEISARTWGFIDVNKNILSVSDPTRVLDREKEIRPIDIINVIAPINSSYLIINCVYRLVGFTPKIFKLSEDETINTLQEDTNILPHFETPEWRKKVVAVYKSYVVILDTAELKFSNDCGKTFNAGVDITAVSQIPRTYHVFENGCLAFFTDNHAYYIESTWTHYEEATCYEADGTTIYTPTGVQNFYINNDHAERKVVNGQDWYVLGNYVTRDEENTRVLLWATTDNGHTYKIIYEFNVDSAYEIRHVHAVVYYEPEDVYIVASGDYDEQNQVFLLRYNDGAWTINRILERIQLADVVTHGEDIYFVYDTAWQGVTKCTFENIENLQSHETVFEGLEINGLLTMFIGLHGDAIIMPTWYPGRTIEGELDPSVRSRIIYYAPKLRQKVWFPVLVPPQIMHGYTNFSGWMPVTEDGHAITGAYTGSTEYWNKLPSVYLDEYVRRAGFPNAFKSAWEV